MKPTRLKNLFIFLSLLLIFPLYGGSLVPEKSNRFFYKDLIKIEIFPSMDVIKSRIKSVIEFEENSTSRMFTKEFCSNRGGSSLKILCVSEIKEDKVHAFISTGQQVIHIIYSQLGVSEKIASIDSMKEEISLFILKELYPDYEEFPSLEIERRSLDRLSEYLEIRQHLKEAGSSVPPTLFGTSLFPQN